MVRRRAARRMAQGRGVWQGAARDAAWLEGALRGRFPTCVVAAPELIGWLLCGCCVIRDIWACPFRPGAWRRPPGRKASPMRVTPLTRLTPPRTRPAGGVRGRPDCNSTNATGWLPRPIYVHGVANQRCVRYHLLLLGVKHDATNHALYIIPQNWIIGF